MAWKGRTQEIISVTDLTSDINASKLKKDDPRSYQSILGLINAGSRLQDLIKTAFIKGVDKLDLSSEVENSLGIKNGGTTFALYNPVLEFTTNITSAAYNDFLFWWRIGDIVGVGGLFLINPTAAGQVQLTFTLPVTSYFTQRGHLGGTANCYTQPGESAGIYADTASPRAILEWVTTFSGSLEPFPFTLMYRVIAKS